MKDEKKYHIEKQSVALGYGQMILPDEPPIVDVEVLLNGLATWGKLIAEADVAIRSCLLYVAHREPRVRAMSITQLSKLLPHSMQERPSAIRAVSTALSDTDIGVREAAQIAADSIRVTTGIQVGGQPSP